MDLGGKDLGGRDLGGKDSGTDVDAEVFLAKQRLRSTIAGRRRALTPAQLADARRAVAKVVLTRCDADVAAGLPWRTVLAYEPLADEPGSSSLLDGLSKRGCAVHVPVERADRDLEWLALSGGVGGAPRGVAFAASADAVLVPAFAVDRRGMRLGRGGGSYDRVLPRVPAQAVLVALLHGGEVVDDVPADAWDRPVRAAASPTGWLDFTTG